jgi:hypothetical protein
MLHMASQPRSDHGEVKRGATPRDRRTQLMAGVAEKLLLREAQDHAIVDMARPKAQLGRSWANKQSTVFAIYHQLPFEFGGSTEAQKGI